MYEAKSGDWIPTNRRNHVVLLDPQGVETVYKRSAKTDRDPRASAAKLVASGLQADHIGGAVSSVAKGVQALRKGKVGSGGTFPSGIGPTGGAARRANLLTELPAVSHARNPMKVEEFKTLPAEGLVNPNRIRTAQRFADKLFKPEAGEKMRRSILGTANKLINSETKAGDVEPIRIFESGGKVFTLDHRRLVAFRLADKPIRYRKATQREIDDEVLFPPRGRDSKMSTTDEGMSIVIGRRQPPRR